MYYKRLVAVLVTVSAVGCLLIAVHATDLVVVDDNNMTVFWGFHGSHEFVDQPEKLWGDTVAWAVGAATPANTDVLLFTYDGTVSDNDPANVDPVGFYNLLVDSGYQVQVDSRLNFRTRTSYVNFELVVFPNFGYSDTSAPPADNVIAAGVPLITMEPAHGDELQIGTGATVFSGTVDRAYVVDNDHTITDEYDLGGIIYMAQEGSPGTLWDVPTDGITTDKRGRVLIGVVPEPGTMIVLAIGTLLGAAHLRRRKRGCR